MKSPREQRNGSIHILIADENPLYRDGLRALLEEQPDFEVVSVASDGEATIRLSRQHQPDILLLDAKMPGKDSMGVLGELQALNAPVRPLLFAAALSTADLRRALQLGARGVVLKSSSSQMLINGIRGVMAGQYWISHELGSRMMEELHQHSEEPREVEKKGAFNLTSRELEIIASVVAGCSNAEIAERLSLSEQTVKHNLSAIFDKLGVFSRLELALFATSHGLLEREE